jgi:hypothetical protein
MKNPLIFASTCSACGQQRLQHGHTLRALVRLIESREIIDAYCLECDVVWPVSTEERVLITCAVAVRQKRRVAADGRYAESVQRQQHLP